MLLQEVIKKIFAIFMAVLDDLLLIMGACLLIYGVRMIYIPAGYIAAGMLLIVTAVILAHKQAGGD